MTSKGGGWAGIAGLAALAGLGWYVAGRAAPVALVVDNPRRARRRRRKRSPQNLERAIAACERSALQGMRPQTFRKKREATRALLDANPELLQLVESDCGSDCTAYQAWVGHGRRGPKPRWRPGDGRFDALNERWDLRTPGRKVASWREALDVTAPSSRRWEDFDGRIGVLEEATGLRLAGPARTEAIGRARALAGQCQDVEQLAGEVVPF
jgi:hypothetical protein